MGCIVEFNANIRFDFAQNRGKQRLWIDALLKFSKTNMDYLAHILDLPTELIIQVHQGTHYLDQELAERLGQLFLITFGT
jgi:hypothetical protein